MRSLLPLPRSVEGAGTPDMLSRACHEACRIQRLYCVHCYRHLPYEQYRAGRRS